MLVPTIRTSPLVVVLVQVVVVVPGMAESIMAVAVVAGEELAAVGSISLPTL